MGEYAGVRAMGPLKRRGLLAMTAALVAGGLAKLAGPGRAEAGHTGLATPEPLHIGVINDGTGASDTETQTSIAARTVLLATGGGVFRARNLTASGTNNSSALEGVANAFGVIGRQTGTIFNHSTFGLAAGVAGVSESSGSGVVGRSTTGAGVRGLSNEGHGVLGMALTNGIDATSGPSGKAGVTGFSDSATGVIGRSTSGTGIHGQSNSGVGAVGSSGGNIGVYGASSANVGVFGDANVNTAVMGRTQTGIGVYGTATNPGGGGRAAVFDGTVLVNGPFTVVGGPKSAGVRHPDGSVRRMYCQEGTEPYFEDVGEATLQNGRAEVALDPDFSAVVTANDYRVFLTPEGDCKGLYVSRKGPNRFVVEELQGGKSTLLFSYRVMARRREAVGGRMEKVDVRPAQSKDVKTPTLPKLSEEPAPHAPAAR